MFCANPSFTPFTLCNPWSIVQSVDSCFVQRNPWIAQILLCEQNKVKRTVLLGEGKMTCGPFTMLFLFERPSVASSPIVDEGLAKVTLCLFVFEVPSGPLVLVDCGLHGMKKEHYHGHHSWMRQKKQLPPLICYWKVH